jgi:hypothetical protein
MIKTALEFSNYKLKMRSTTSVLPFKNNFEHILHANVYLNELI